MLLPYKAPEQFEAKDQPLPELLEEEKEEAVPMDDTFFEMIESSNPTMSTLP